MSGRPVSRGLAVAIVLLFGLNAFALVSVNPSGPDQSGARGQSGNGAATNTTTAASPAPSGTLEPPETTNSAASPTPTSDPAAPAGQEPRAAASTSDAPRPGSCPPKSDGCPWLSDKLEEVNWDQALAWWPHGPVLADDDPQHFGRSTETVAVGTDTGGRSGDPRKEFTQLAALYQVPGKTVREGEMFAVLSAGGMAVWTSIYPPDFPFQPEPSTDPRRQTVTLRGHEADVVESPDQDFRMILYYDPLPNGGTKVTQFFSAISQRTVEEAVEWGNQLFERQPHQ